MTIAKIFSSVFIFFFVLIFFFVNTSTATTHVIEFGGSNGFAYVPNTLHVNVGDTIEWIGSFSSHPLQSTSVPLGADPFGPVNIGSTFFYAVKVEGQYDYQCNIHFAGGMKGSFTTAIADVSDVQNSISSLQNFPNPFNASTIIHYELKTPATVNITITDITGKIVVSVSSFQDIGTHEMNFDGSRLPCGAYFCQIRSGEAVLNRQLIVSH
jgi:plastocyanin